MQLRFAWPAALLCLACAACSTTAPAPGLGETKATAIEVCRPQGQRAYLSRLSCPDGTAPQFHRIGSFGQRHEMSKEAAEQLTDEQRQRIMRGAPLQPGEIDHHVVDGYELSCGSTQRRVFMDMYHCGQPAPEQAPQGFGIRPAGQLGR